MDDDGGPQVQNNNNVVVAREEEVEDEEEEEEEEDNNDEDEEDDDDDDDEDDDQRQQRQPNNNNANNADQIDGNVVMDAGVAEAGDGEADPTQQEASSADLVLYITWSPSSGSSKEETEREHPTWKDHPVLLRETVTVKIGLDKATKLSSVFARYVAFCNEKRRVRLQTSDLEFSHCDVLDDSNTAEAAALMKNDKILVRKERTIAKEKAVEERRAQAESDRVFFAQMGQLSRLEECDTVLHCLGNLKGEGQSGTKVPCHAGIVKQRCPWLGDLIAKAKRDRQDASREQRVVSGEVEDEEAVMPLDRPEPPPLPAEAAAQIENDDGDLAVSEVVSAKIGMYNVLLANHHPNAVKLLLEYIYTNRAVALGREAFTGACRTKPGWKHKGPIPPYPFRIDDKNTARWPEKGNPQVSYSVALAGIVLAEEARMPRLSLMCEIAAAQLVHNQNFLEALRLCEMQKRATQNPLPRLRRAAMAVVLNPTARGVLALPPLRAALKDHGESLVPTLLTGTMEAVEHGHEDLSHHSHHHHSSSGNSSKRSNKRKAPSSDSDWQMCNARYLKQLKQVDRDDRKEREYERKKYRRGGKDEFDDSDFQDRRYGIDPTTKDSSAWWAVAGAISRGPGRATSKLSQASRRSRNNDGSRRRGSK